MFVSAPGRGPVFAFRLTLFPSSLAQGAKPPVRRAETPTATGTSEPPAHGGGNREERYDAEASGLG
jgi:hypothetical protein